MLNQEDPWLAMLTYRDTVVQATGKSPAELIIGRHLRTKLPHITTNIDSAEYEHGHRAGKR